MNSILYHFLLCQSLPRSSPFFPFSSTPVVSPELLHPCRGFSSVPQAHPSLQLWVSLESFPAFCSAAPSSPFHIAATFSALSWQPLLALKALPVVPYPYILIPFQFPIKAPFPGIPFLAASLLQLAVH